MVGAADEVAAYDRAADNTLLTMALLTMNIELMM